MCVHLVLAGIVVIRDIQSQVRLYHVATPTVVTGGAAHSCAASHTTYDKSTRVDQLSIYNIVKHYFYGAGDILVLTFFSAFRQTMGSGSSRYNTCIISRAPAIQEVRIEDDSDRKFVQTFSENHFFSRFMLPCSFLSYVADLLRGFAATIL